MRKKEKTCESLENASKSLNIYLKTPVLFNRETGVFRLSKFFRGFRQKFGGQLWGREKIKAKN